MLSLLTLIFGFYSGPQHLIHCLWYLIRSFTVENEALKVEFPVAGSLKRSWLDLLTIPMTTTLLTVPVPACGDFVFVPYIVYHVMGYTSPVWFSVFPGALLTMYLSRRPEGILCSMGALMSREIRGDNRQLGILMASVCHGMLAGFEAVFSDSEFSLLSAIVVLCMAESKLNMHWEYELVPPLGSLFALPVYVMNYFMWGWQHRWHFTDKVWRSLDIIYPITNVAGAFVVGNYI